MELTPKLSLFTHKVAVNKQDVSWENHNPEEVLQHFSCYLFSAKTSSPQTTISCKYKLWRPIVTSGPWFCFNTHPTCIMGPHIPYKVLKLVELFSVNNIASDIYIRASSYLIRILALSFELPWDVILQCNAGQSQWYIFSQESVQCHCCAFYIPFCVYSSSIVVVVVVVVVRALFVLFIRNVYTICFACAFVDTLKWRMSSILS